MRRHSSASGVIVSTPSDAVTDSGKSFVFAVHSTVASAAIAAARTWRSSSSGSERPFSR
jgi:hypothetical protein